MEFEKQLPKGWGLKSFDEIQVLKETGLVRNRDEQVERLPFRYVKMNNITSDGRLDLKDITYVDANLNEVKRYSLRVGDFLFNTRNSAELVGKTCLFELDEPKILFNNNILRVRFEKGVSSKFINYQFQSEFVKNQLEKYKNKTTNVCAIYYKNLGEVKIILPPLPEQTRIVAKLDALFERIDQAIGLLEKNIRQTGELGKAILNDAVSGKLIAQNTNDEQAQSFIEKLQKAIKSRYPKSTFEKVAKQEFELPKGWTTIRLADYTLINTGATPLTTKKEYYEGEIAWVTSSATNAPFVTKAEKFISEKALAETNCKIFPKNTLLVALYGQGKTRGQITELLIEAATNQACAAIEFYTDHSFFKDFIKLFFQNNYEAIRSLSDGGTQANLNLSKIKNTIIPIPPYEEQRRIVTKYKTLSEKLEKMNSFNLQKLQSLKSLKSSLLDQAFRGEL
jgi:type I restriction enzyme, S subunit